MRHRSGHERHGLVAGAGQRAVVLHRDADAPVPHVARESELLHRRTRHEGLPDELAHHDGCILEALRRHGVREPLAQLTPGLACGRRMDRQLHLPPFRRHRVLLIDRHQVR